MQTAGQDWGLRVSLPQNSRMDGCHVREKKDHVQIQPRSPTPGKGKGALPGAESFENVSSAETPNNPLRKLGYTLLGDTLSDKGVGAECAVTESHSPSTAVARHRHQRNPSRGDNPSAHAPRKSLPVSVCTQKGLKCEIPASLQAPCPSPPARWPDHMLRPQAPLRGLRRLRPLPNVARCRRDCLGGLSAAPDLNKLALLWHRHQTPEAMGQALQRRPGSASAGTTAGDPWRRVLPRLRTDFKNPLALSGLQSK